MKQATDNVQSHEGEKAFAVTITETYTKQVTVYASELKEATIAEAIQAVSDRWYMIRAKGNLMEVQNALP